ncbi:M14 family zinc carboxypeptidase [Nocardioides sp.]|uniref:M14 family zinc carboxypeptidase n=1 Tax=Nocardioides sp. TaxID=35761 RepID=UPI00356AE972
MNPRSLRPRTALGAALVAVALTGTALAQPTLADRPSAASFTAKMVLVDTPTSVAKQRLQRIGLDLTEHAGHDYIEVVLHTPEEEALLRDAGFSWTVKIPDLLRRQGEINAADEAYAARVAVSPLPSGRTSYRRLADYNSEMTELAAKNPKLVKAFDLPRPSLDGRTIQGIEIGADVTKPASGRPTFLLMGLHHAREWPSGENAMEFAHDLVKNYGKNKQITRLLKKGRVVVVPVVNPDGFEMSITDGSVVDLRAFNEHDPLDGTTSILATPGQAYKRKNCRVMDGQDTPDGSCRLTLASPGGFGLGVDLNRNYGGLWGGPGVDGPTPNPAELELGYAGATYRGAAPFSEPETQNIHDLVAERQVTMLISNHTFSNLILRPNGVNPATIGHDGIPVGDAPDEKGLKVLGAKMAEQNGYRNIHGWELYDTTGTTEDWSYNATGGYGYTFEIGPDEFHPPFEHVVDEYVGAGKYAGKGNRAAYLLALEHAVSKKPNGLIKGKAPKGAVLRLKKDFDTPTWSSSFKDGIDTPITVLNRRGTFSWLVNPSTRPAVRSRTYYKPASKPYAAETFTGTAAPLDHNDHEFKISGRTAPTWEIDLDWETPDDLDLEVYRKEADGTLTEVGGSGNMPGSKEHVTVQNATPGTYVLRVINYASITPSYTMTSELFDAKKVRTKGKRESYTLTCERKDGKVLQKTKVFIDRGQTKKVNLKACRKKW